MDDSTMEIKISRRILFLGAREAGVLDVIKDLTGTAPAPDTNGSTAGLNHEWNVKTEYYSATVPIWIDEVPDFEAWKEEFLKVEAKEVVDAVGAWIFCFEREQDGDITDNVEAAMKSIQEVLERHAVYGGEVVLLTVAKTKARKAQATSAGAGEEENEDKCIQYGFEFIDYAATGRTEYGEKVGFERLKEALEANEWTAREDDLELDDLGFDGDDDDGLGGFARDEAEMTAELFGMKAALNQDEDENDIDTEDFMSPQRQKDQVDDLDRMMGKLLAIKEQSADLPEQQRKRMAAQAVKDLMKERSST
ncbi:hypothetical protein DOTSEDRAFT_69706 [Dothistroma septosporum NZE10]|uniref:Increased recombination centers protein 6 n=1 Tax=Dothistroma septosporum (strain NZE10 / CBS 128990) TaxID=675120 RepID=N1PWG4_DOTSN|nr:hypothetical protein DOTSEDRAFT_69706 [Dothistroma septosporum NZE10]